MAETQTQTYRTHVRRTPALYNAAFLVLLVNVLWAAYRLIQLVSFDTLLALLVAIALVIVGGSARTQTLTVQNRVIRLEERLRYERLLPPDMAARAAALPVTQIVALRFASDAELPALVADVLSGQVSAPKDIKMRVKDWRADFLRA
jgi:uncharacterized membrane protein